MCGVIYVCEGEEEHLAYGFYGLNGSNCCYIRCLTG